MIKSYPLVAHLDTYTEDLQISTVRGHKYYAFVKEIDKKDCASKLANLKFLKKVKKAKIVKAFKCSGSSSQFKLGMTKQALKFNSQNVQELDLSALPYHKNSSSNKSFLLQIKKLKKLCIPNDQKHITGLAGSRKLESLLIKMQNHEEKVYTQLYNRLTRLRNLKNLCSVVHENCLGKTLRILNKASVLFDQSLKLQILAKDEHSYNGIQDLSRDLSDKISKLSVKYMNSECMLKSVFSQTFHYLNLRTLKLKFSVPDLELDPHLKYLKQMTSLEKLSLSFPECWDTELIEGFVTNLHLPLMLQDLQIAMPLFLNDHLLRYGRMEQENGGYYPWRRTNIFEEESLFSNFFQTLEQLQRLKNLELDFQLIESFNSSYTNFFVSIVNRVPKISSFALHVTDCSLQEDSTHKMSEPFDLALFFQACSKLKNLENIEIVVPNLLFEDASIDHKMTNLKSFIIGTSEREEEDIKFHNISKHITGWLRRLFSIAPNLKSLIFDFVEVIDEPSFCKRFMMIERFKQLESFCSKFVINQCTIESGKKIGRMIQSLPKLNTFVLEFTESDKNVLEMRNYLNYKKSIRDLLFSFDDQDWIGKDDKSEYEV